MAPKRPFNLHQQGGQQAVEALALLVAARLWLPQFKNTVCHFGGPCGIAGTIALRIVFLGDHSKPLGPSYACRLGGFRWRASRFCRHNGVGNRLCWRSLKTGRPYRRLPPRRLPLAGLTVLQAQWCWESSFLAITQNR